MADGPLGVKVQPLKKKKNQYKLNEYVTEMQTFLKCFLVLYYCLNPLLFSKNKNYRM